MNIFRFLTPKSRVEYIESDDSVRQAVEKMRYHHYVAIPILDKDGTYVGTLRTDDLYKYFLENGKFDYKAMERDGVMKIYDPDYAPPILHSSSFEELVAYVTERNFAPIVDDRGCFIGLVLRRDVLEFLFAHYKKTAAPQ